MKKRSLLGVILLLLGIAIAFFIHQGVNCHFRPMDNCKGRTVCLDMDFEDAVTDGIYLPSKRQTDDGSGLFTFRFIAPKKDLFYKIYYQNETYKFPDTSALADENGDLVVCFLSTNDITGGNSGSPIMNDKGELIGLAFDGNWEAMSGDVNFEPKLQRTINVDIRYVLFVIDKYAGATNLIDELDIHKSEPQPLREEEETTAEYTFLMRNAECGIRLPVAGNYSAFRMKSLSLQPQCLMVISDV